MKVGDGTVQRHRGAIRLGLLGFAGVQVLLGVWILIDMRGFFTSFPGAGLEWASPYGPYNAHMLTDIGGLFLATGAVLLLAALWMTRRVVQAALIGYILFQAPHFIYHAGADDVLPGWEAIASPVVTGMSLLAAFALLVMAGQSGRPRRAVPASVGRPRISPRQDGWVARASRWHARRRYGGEAAPAQVFANHPTLAIGYGAFELAAERARSVDHGLKHLAELKAATLVNCEWCIDFGSYLAQRQGMREEQVVGLANYEESDAFDPVERLVLDYAVAMTRTPAHVDDVLSARLREHFDDAQLVELTATIAIENLRARFNHAAGIAPQGFSDDMVCARPEVSATV